MSFKINFQSPVSHDPSDIIQLCWRWYRSKFNSSKEQHLFEIMQKSLLTYLVELDAYLQKKKY